MAHIVEHQAVGLAEGHCMTVLEAVMCLISIRRMLEMIPIEVSPSKPFIQSCGYLGAFESFREDWAIKIAPIVSHYNHVRKVHLQKEAVILGGVILGGQETLIHARIAILVSCFLYLEKLLERHEELNNADDSVEKTLEGVS